MTDLDTLGRRHKKLVDDLADLRAEIADAIRAERAAGATYASLAQRSGYTTETVRQILNPTTREKANMVRRRAAGEESAKTLARGRT